MNRGGWVDRQASHWPPRSSFSRGAWLFLIKEAVEIKLIWVRGIKWHFHMVYFDMERNPNLMPCLLVASSGKRNSYANQLPRHSRLQPARAIVCWNVCDLYTRNESISRQNLILKYTAKRPLSITTDVYFKFTRCQQEGLQTKGQSSSELTLAW